jgi:DNA-directed RNA polymerase subunit beta'
LAYSQGQIELHSLIWVRYKKEFSNLGGIVKNIRLEDHTTIEYYQNLQVRKDNNKKIIVKYLQTTTGQVIFNYVIQKTLNLLEN